MTDTIRVQLESGPKGKKVVAVAPDWPGLSRGSKTEDDALVRLTTYLRRYAPVATLAGLADAFPASATPEVVDRYPGVGSTDFWGISFAHSSLDHQPLTAAELDRQLALLSAAWTFFDQTRARVSEEMQKGPRGGGKDREQIARHTLYAELDMAQKVAVRTPFEQLAAPEGIAAHRTEFLAAIRAYHAEGKPARTWPFRYLIRHTAFHTLDHAWEMEDKDLTGI